MRVASVKPKTAAMAVLFLACASLGVARAQEGADPTSARERALQAYRITTQRALNVCSEALSAWRVRARTVSYPLQYRDCVASALDDSAAKLDSALRALPQGESLRALREYHRAFAQALVGIEPQEGERAGAYEERQTFLLHRQAHAWARFESVDSLTP